MSALQEIANQLKSTNLKPDSEDIQAWKEIRDEFPRIERELDNQERAGFDVSLQKQAIKELKDRVDQLLRVYG